MQVNSCEQDELSDHPSTTTVPTTIQN